MAGNAEPTSTTASPPPPDASDPLGEPGAGEPKLRRTINLPLLVFYGVGVTVGAGIFALVGEILDLAGDRAPQSFLLSGVIAGLTGAAYALLVRVYPRAGGEAVFVNRGLGALAARLAGYGVLAVGVISSAVVALAFAGYIREIVDVPATPVALAVVALLAGVACWGIRESVIAAAIITLLELITLLVVVVFGIDWLTDADVWARGFSVTGGDGALGGWQPVLAGAVLGFFAFVGFEDIENMAEETVNPRRTAPLAIAWTLGLTIVFYVALALVAIAAPDRAAVTGSDAPLAEIFHQLTGRSGDGVAAMASVAMINGILVQIVMASRVLYGMANERLVPGWFGGLNRARRTPVRATVVLALAIMVLVIFFPLVALAELTSVIVLAVFGLVNLSLFRLGGQPGIDHLVRRFRWLGLVGAAASVALIAVQLTSGVGGGH